MSDNTVHRLLDEAFADVEMTPETRDLKEEIRANLMDRVSELTASGVAPEEAARRAVDELGDVHELLGTGGTADAGSEPGPGVPEYGAARRESITELAHRNRVTPTPRYVAGVVGASLIILLALAGAAALLVGIARREVGPDVLWGVPALMALAGPATGWIVASSLARETSTNYALPRRRAAAYGVAAMLVVIGLMIGGYMYLMTGRLAGVVIGGVVWVLLGLAYLVYLLTTQTNRKKPWVLQADAALQPANRFEEDPASAARFGIYAVVIWTLSGLACLIVGLAAGWIWAGVPAAVGFVVFMLVLARMLFGQQSKN
jgi:MFS family permease